ncbi:MAG: Hsp20/alpha crystallin family protein [Chloroflexi bacterium]|nr:Hsp20/alpha crystallin family protein [Chloroflexota bacterium]
MADREQRQLARWDPFQQLSELQEEIGRWWDRDWWPWPTPRLARRAALWAPRVDMYEEGNELVVKAELPGVQKSDISVTVEDNDLVLRGERKAEQEVKEEHYYRLERSYGGFYRRLPMPAAVDVEKIKATLQDGVLEVRVAKPAATPPPKGKEIPVS